MAVCLHCLHEARVAARERRNRAIMRFGAWTLSLTVVGVVGTAATNAVMRQPEAPPPRRVTKPALRRPDTVAAAVAAAPVMQQGAPAPAPAPTPTPDSTAHLAGPPLTTASVGAIADSIAKPTARVLMPVIPIGRTDLPDSLYAERRGDTIVVHFDTSPARTRRADKFELVVRQTLKAVYGPAADSLLAAVPPGRLAAPNELLTTLPRRGIHLTGPSGARLVLWPETRPGRDGLLAVAYRATAER
jgi:hypothetical protein